MLFRSDRKSTRLNSSHTIISYAVFCLKKKRPPLATTHQTAHKLVTHPAREQPRGARLRRVGKQRETRGSLVCPACALFFFFFIVAAPTEIYPFSLPAALPI